ncbi:MAG: alpha/beta hydrolase [Actinobacteria bacterium]|nr:alpha/beta hydrolase [Actinomycetota bacterium]
MPKTGFAPSDGAQIYYETDGNGPPLMLIHAGVADSRMWSEQLVAFSETHKVVAFDQRGFGNTPWVPKPYADRSDVLAVMDHLDIESAVMVGCSIGGGIALHVSLDAPDRVDGLVLIGAVARGWEPERGWPSSPKLEAAEAANEAGHIEEVLDLEAEIWLAGEGRALEDLDRSLVDLFIDMDRIPLSTEKERGEFVEPFEPPVNERLAEITMPCLTVVGAHDLPDMIESAEYLANRISDRNHVVIENAAHLPSLEQPEAFNKALRVFLDTM